MKYHIDTIPVWDAYKAGHECPICALRDETELELVELFLGESVMEPDRRVEVNAKGFCARHLKRMFQAGNKLGLALMCHTHLKETIARYEEVAGSRLHGRRKPLAALSSCCVFCEQLEHTVNRYLYTLIHLWRSEAEFRDQLCESHGLCLPHYAALLDMASHELNGAAYGKFETAMHEVQSRDLQQLEKDIEWFTLKFDYRNQDKPWGESKDAVERVMNKLRGKCVSGEV